jgi:hypothetical protein
MLSRPLFVLLLHTGTSDHLLVKVCESMTLVSHVLSQFLQNSMSIAIFCLYLFLTDGKKALAAAPFPIFVHWSPQHPIFEHSDRIFFVKCERTIFTITQNNRKITLLNILISIFNKICLPSNNLLQNNSFGPLSKWLPQTKDFSPDKILTMLMPIYRTSIYNPGSPLTERHLPDYSFVSFNTASRCQNYIRAQHVFSAWQLPDKCHRQQVACVLVLSARNTTINTAGVFWLVEKNRVSQNASWGHICTS